MQAGYVGGVPKLGVYIHFPFCRNVCPYCDFAVARAPTGGIPHDTYTSAILAELAARGPEVEGSLRSIYFGGGTPSLWKPSCLAAVISAVRERYADAAATALEITLEANPSDCTPDLLAQWQAAGINRVSIGVQSFAPSTLAVLGRDHRMGEGRDALAAALGAGLSSLSADFILGVPDPARGGAGEADAGALQAAALGVPHLSVYELTIESRTWFGKRVRAGELTPVTDELIASAYASTHHALEALGYEHYEVSSYARSGHRAVHNQLYWQGASYLGLGNGAASLRRLPGGGGVRQTNLRSMRRYLEAAPDERVAESVTIEADELATELVWLGLRTSAGVPLGCFDDRPRCLQALQAKGLVTIESATVKPTLTGFLFSNQIASLVIAG